MSTHTHTQKIVGEVDERDCKIHTHTLSHTHKTKDIHDVYNFPSEWGLHGGRGARKKKMDSLNNMSIKKVDRSPPGKK